MVTGKTEDRKEASKHTEATVEAPAHFFAVEVTVPAFKALCL